MNLQQNDLIIVTPTYNDSESCKILCSELFRLYNTNIYIIIVDDGCLIQPIEADVISKSGGKGTILTLNRNVGHQKAIAVGLNYLSEFHVENNVVIMDSDGEDEPSSIKKLTESLKDENIDLVVAKRKNRTESLKFKIFYVVYKIIFKILTGREINFGNFMSMKPQALKRLVAMNEVWIHTAGAVLNSKLKIKSCSLDRGLRYAGKSKMNFVSLCLHGLKAIMVFAEDVLVRVGTACSFLAFFSISSGLIAILLKICGFATPGWFSIALGILLIVFLQTGMLSLMTLMLTGVVKNGNEPSIDYKKYIDKVTHVS